MIRRDVPDGSGRGCRTDASVPWHRRQDLTVGANVGNVPWEFQDDSGAIVGFEVDLATEVAKRLGRDIKIENIPFNGLFSAVQSGRIDMAMSSITITEKRLAEVSFAQPYYDSDQSLTVTAASGLKGLADMSGKVIGVDTGSTGDMWATENQAKYGFAEIRRFEGLAPAMLDLGNGRIDGYISDIPALQYYSKDKPAVRRGRADPDRRAVFDDVRQGRAACGGSQHDPDGAEGRGLRCRDPQEVVRFRSRGDHLDRDRHGHAGAQVTYRA